MTLPFLIHDDADHERAVALIDALWGAAHGTPEAQVLEVMAFLVDLYERQTSDLGPADPVMLIEFKLRELHWSQRELGRRLGWSTGRVSEVLRRKRGLTLRMVQDLSRVLGITPGLLVPDPLERAPANDPGGVTPLAVGPGNAFWQERRSA